MSCSPAVFSQKIGGGSSVDREGYEQLITHVESAGSPVGALVPEFIGQECFDTTGGHFYKATGLTAADWKQTTV